ncbi:MAG TPA: hypothetical protein DEP51_07130 [Clostridiales bacterium]|nr:hypothetical protein [Clostridiales bacterium]
MNLEGNYADNIKYEDMLQDNGTISFTVHHSGIGEPTLSTVTLTVNYDKYISINITMYKNYGFT